VQKPLEPVDLLTPVGGRDHVRLLSVALDDFAEALLVTLIGPCEGVWVPQRFAEDVVVDPG